MHPRPITSEYLLGLIPRGGAPYNGPYGEGPPEMGYERVGISLVEVSERIGVISVGKKRAQKGQQTHFVAVKTFWVCDLFNGILKKVQLQQ